MNKKDRNDYRAMHTDELINEVNYSIDPDWRELSCALAERLRELQHLEDWG